jgi:hypothetical protein
MALRFLAFRGPSSPYDIASMLNLHRSSTNKALKRLKRDGRVIVVGRRKARSGVRVEVYDISIHGLIEVLKSCKTIGDAESIIYNHAGKLPLVFGKWSFFRENNVEGIAFKLLKEFSYTGWSGAPFKSRIGTPEYEREYAEYFQWTFYLSACDTLSREEFGRWMTAIRMDNDIRGFIINQIGEEKRILQERVRELEELEKSLISSF